VELEVLIIGIGGQGIQLVGKTLALAATHAGRHAMLAAEYGGEMRGGPSQSTVVIGDRPLRALPILPSAGSAIVMHDKFAGPIPSRLRADGVLLVNASIVAPPEQAGDRRVLGVRADELAREIGAPQAAGFVALGAFNRLTGVVEHELLVEAMSSLLPPYRKQHAEANAAALAAGSEAVLAGAEASA
jgi:2-oxoglutarate ferredoxin oxidoreductase subunit gamma